MEHFVIKTNGSSYFMFKDEDGTPRFTDTIMQAEGWQEYDKAKEFGQSLLGKHGQTCFQIEKLYL